MSWMLGQQVLLPWPGYLDTRVGQGTESLARVKESLATTLPRMIPYTAIPASAISSNVIRSSLDSSYYSSHGCP